MAEKNDSKRQRFMSILCRYPDFFVEKHVKDGEKDETLGAEKRRKCFRHFILMMILMISCMGEAGVDEERRIRYSRQQYLLPQKI